MRLVQPQTMYTRYCNTPSAKVAICPNVGWLQGLRRRPDDARPDVQRQEHPPAGQLQLAELDDPAINNAMDKAEVAPQGAARRGLGRRSTSRSRRRRPAIPWIWDKQPLIQSANVNGVASRVNNSQWELAWTSLK